MDSITIKNTTTGVTYEIELSREEKQRFMIDQDFASQKMQEVADFAIAEQTQDEINSNWTKNSENLVLVSEGDDLSRKENEESCIESCTLAEKQDISFFKWCHEAILLLIEEYRNRVDDFLSGRISQKKVWEAISQILKSKGYNVTGPQCMSKFNSLKKTYKSVKDHNSKSGNATKSWPYFDLIDGLIGSKPFISPVATVSSTGKRCRSENPIESSNEESRPKRSPQVLNNKDILMELQKSRNITEQNRERRHKEKIEQKEKCLELFAKMIETLKKEN